MEKGCFKFRDKKILLGEKTYVMGILNVTPDSFSDGGKHFCLDSAITAAINMEKQGADFLDIGGQSTRPGAKQISASEEWQRLEPVLTELVKKVSTPISVDTFYPEVAKKALQLGADIINDVSGSTKKEMAEVVKEYSAGWILMHNEIITSSSPCSEVKKTLERLKNEAISFGVDSEYICLDPGIGFSKTNEQNLMLIINTADVKPEGSAYLLAASRKSCLAYAVREDFPPEMRDPATVAVNTVGILGGADIIRVHNVAFAYQTAKLVDNMKGSRLI